MATNCVDHRSTIANLFQQKLKTQIDQTRGREQFSTLNNVYLFKIKSSQWPDSEYWTLDFKIGCCYPGKPRNQISPDSVYLIEADDLIDFLNGKLNSAKAYLSGKIKLLGNTAAAFKLHHFLIETKIDLEESKQINSKVEKDYCNDHCHPIPIDGLKCDILFEIIQSRLSSEHELVRQISFVIQIIVSKDQIPKVVWTIDTMGPDAHVYRSKPYERTAIINGNAAATLTIEDDDFVALLFGKLNVQRAFMKGLLKVKGNIMLLQRLNALWNQIQKTRNYPELPFVKDILLNTSFQKGLQSVIVFFDLIQRLVRIPDLFPPGRSVNFSITKYGIIESEWIIVYDELGKLTSIKYQNPYSNQAESNASPVQCIKTSALKLIIEDEDFVRLCRDVNFTLQYAIASAKVNIIGDQSLLPQVEELFVKISTLKSKL